MIATRRAPIMYVQLALFDAHGLTEGSVEWADLAIGLAEIVPYLLDVMRAGRGSVKIHVEQGRVVGCAPYKEIRFKD